MPYKDPAKKREYQREYKLKNKERRHASILDYERSLYAKRRDDPEFIQRRREKNARYRARHRLELAAAQNARNQKRLADDPAGTRERQRAVSRKRRATNAVSEKERERARNASKTNYQKRKDDHEYKAENAARASAWYRGNSERAKENSKRSRRKRVSEDINVKLGLALRRRLWMALRGKSCKGSAVRDLGCSLDDLRAHLESLFLPGMEWANWGLRGWHIDHIRPLKEFDLTDQHQRAEACRWSNLQPLWAAQNIGKGARPGKPRPNDWPGIYQTAMDTVANEMTGRPPKANPLDEGTQP
jgi:hypothetical protein